MPVTRTQCACETLASYWYPLHATVYIQAFCLTGDENNKPFILYVYTHYGDVTCFGAKCLFPSYKNCTFLLNAGSQRRFVGII